MIAKAKANNMPNDTIDRGIKKAAGDGNAVNYEHVTYAIIVKIFPFAASFFSFLCLMFANFECPDMFCSPFTFSSISKHVTYEGYGPNGIAIIVEALTDNKNRTAANVRSAFTKGNRRRPRQAYQGFCLNF